MVDRPDVNWAYTVKGVTAGQKINKGGAAESEAFTPGTTKITDSKNNEILVLAGQDNMIITGQSDLNASFRPSDLDLGANPKPALGDFVDGVKITFDISKFATPGVYRFVVSEGDATGPNSKDVEAMDVTVDGAKKPYQKERFLDVYVRLKEGGAAGEKEIYGYVLHSGDTSVTNNQSGNKHAGDKNSGFDGDGNKQGKKDTPQGYTRYVPRKIKIDKKISGMINKDNAFPFIVNLYHNKATGQDTDNGELQVKVKLPDANGYVVKKVSEIPNLGASLKDNQSLEIIGLPKMTTFDVKERNNAPLTIKSDVRFSTNIAAPVPEDNTNPVLSETLPTTQLSTARDKSLEANNVHVAYHNHIDEITPTGVVLTVAPYAMMMAVAGSMGFMFFNRKKEEE